MRLFILCASMSFLGGAVFACSGGDPATLPGTSQGSGTGGAGGSGGLAAQGGGGQGGSVGQGGAGGGSGGAAPVNCGDGNVDYAAGEQCDDGNKANGDGCSDKCTVEKPATCGDGALDLGMGEECDDGNLSGGDGCNGACQLEPVGQLCGDGKMQGLEVCDDSNTINGDGCNPTCNIKGVTTLFAGSPGQKGSVDGVGMQARFEGAGVMAADDKYLWLSESNARVIRRIEVSTATVSTIAGQAAMSGYKDDPVGTNARFGAVEGLASDGQLVYVGDQSNRVLRAVAVAAPHAVTTIAGSAGVQGHVDGVGAAARFDGMRGATYYKGLVYILDEVANTLRSIDPKTGEVKTLAGTPYQMGSVDGIGAAARFNSPRYMASDNSGNLFISETNGSKIRMYNTVTGEVKTFAGTGMCGYQDGIGAAALVNRPRGITSDGSSIYFAEFNAHTIRQGIIATQDVSTLAGTPPACSLTCSCGMMMTGGYAEGTGSAAQFANPFSIVFYFPSNSLFVLDGNNAVIRQIQ